MKFLKSFNESVQENIISEIETIRHIVEDEGFDFHLSKNSDGNIGISVSRPLTTKREMLNKKEDLTLVGDQNVEEFEDRLKEICLNYSYFLVKLKNTTKNGYSVWHLFSNKKYYKKFKYEN